MTLISLPFKSHSTVNLGLHSGAASGNIGLIKFALDNGQPVDSVVKGLLPIHAACANGHVQVVNYLLERGADVNARRRPRQYSGSLLTSNEESGSTPLHFAASNGSVSLINLLLSWGANVNVVDKYGSTPYSVAHAKKNYGAAALLQNQSQSSTLSATCSTPSLQNCEDIKSGILCPSLLSPQSTPSSTTAISDKSSDDEKSDPESDSESEGSQERDVGCLTLNLPAFPRSKSFTELNESLVESKVSVSPKHKTIHNIFRRYHKSSSTASLLP